MSIKLYDVERAIKNQQSTWLYVVEQRWGVNCNLFRLVHNVQTKVYGVEAGQEGHRKHSTFTGVIVGDAFNPSDDWSGGTLAEGYLLTTSKDPQVGDLVEVDREDIRNRRFKIVKLESIGTSDKVFNKLILSSVGD